MGKFKFFSLKDYSNKVKFLACRISLKGQNAHFVAWRGYSPFRDAVWVGFLELKNSKKCALFLGVWGESPMLRWMVDK